MLKKWHDVVEMRGENPKMLLAAAIVNASKNYSLAYTLVQKDSFNGISFYVCLLSFQTFVLFIRLREKALINYTQMHSYSNKMFEFCYALNDKNGKNTYFIF